MSDKKREDNQDEKSLSESKVAVDTSRRKFLRTSGIAAGGVIGGAVLGGLFNSVPNKGNNRRSN
ncbi:twin-arginine translocation signal domain-containing protein [Oceanobacillus sp. AG]|uniref:twin-arginine translocation signal domain-containing protein n=1 Tax=Oceanobacillus sp. AG TaxID=2681969 RepID=UPI001E37DF62|nr:twin-arginine translocation signal domain-containing protein [Oceanobacillus sp. AG]